MFTTAPQYRRFVAILLLITVASQIAYLALLRDVGIVEGWPLRSIIWTIETVTFSLLAVAALAALASGERHRLVWAAVAVSGIFNALQAGMGLSMFLAPTQAGDTGKLLFDTVLAGAFLFFFLAKVLIGVASAMLGVALFQQGSGLGKIMGVLSVIAGIAAVALNTLALPQGLAMVFPAGAAGTVATVMLAIATWRVGGAKR